MKYLVLICILLFLSNVTMSQKSRLIVTTDIGQDPDDQQSMVRLLHMASEFELEGLIANADANYDKEEPILKDHIIHDLIDCYGEIENNLRLHDPDYPTAEFLHTIVKKGTFGNGNAVPVDQFIGEGKDTEGSDWIIEVVDREDPSPLCVAVWGGACDLAQALWKVKHTREKPEVREFVSKLRVFFIGLQDSSNQWIIDNFPEMWLILALDRGGDKWESGYRGMFWGGDMSNTSKEWLHGNIIGKNPLASKYPDQAYTGREKRNPHMAMKEGDSPSFLFFLNNGLNQPDHPEWGGWGGRYSLERDDFYRDANDDYFDEQAGQVINSPRATVFRWRPQFQNDFIARAQWGINNYEDANHHPLITINGDDAKNVSRLDCKPGQKISLDASTSSDPDGDQLEFLWFCYPEAGSYQGELDIENDRLSISSLTIPEDASGKTVHVICQVNDQGEPALTSYKRILLEIK